MKPLLRRLKTTFHFHTTDFVGYYSALLDKAKHGLIGFYIGLVKGKEAKREYQLQNAASIDRTPYNIFCEIYTLMLILNRDILKSKLLLDSEAYRHGEYYPELADLREVTVRYFKEYRKRQRKGLCTRSLTIDTLLELEDINERQLEWHGVKVTEWLNSTMYSLEELEMINGKIVEIHKVDE